MYKFSALKDMSDYCPDYKVASLQLFSEYNEVKIQGILRTLFGEPLYETDNFEDAYCYLIEAVRSNGPALRFSVYQGSSGCAIGAMGVSKELNEAIRQFCELLKNTKPSDFIYEGCYMDAYVKIRQGIQDGKIIYEEFDFS